MPDQRKHRGPHPEDERLFSTEALPALRNAVGDLSWLWSRGYAAVSSVKLVGDRYRLDARQRLAVARCACGDAQLVRRRRHSIDAAKLRGGELWIDGFNVLTSIEAALAGGAILTARDGCYRDMASMHGNYRRVDETLPAIELVGRTIATLGVSAAHWLLDQPVSNSGRLKVMLHDAADRFGWTWRVEVVPDPDPVLIASPWTVATSDSQILDGADRWFNLTRQVIDRHVPQPWRVALATDEQ